MAVVDMPGSKSLTARALFLAACASGDSRLRRPLLSDDTEAFTEALASLGHTVRTEGEDWIVTGSAAARPVQEAEVYCRDAGTVARFLPVLAAARKGTYRFDASEQMRRRPMGPLFEALRELGADVVCEGAEGHLPATINARGLKGGRIVLDAGVSSQFLTALLMAGPLFPDGLEVEVSELVSVPYVEMTLAVMREFGAQVRREGKVFHVAPGHYTAREYDIEPDASTSSYFFAAAAVTGNTVVVNGLGSRSLQGDVRFARVLGDMGADVEFTDEDIRVTGTGNLHGLEVNMRDISDTMPTLAAVAPFADAPVRIVDVYNTRVKECDRLAASADNLTHLGIDTRTGQDWIEVRPGTPDPAVIACHADHRIAMSFTVTSLRLPEPLLLDDPACARKTFPDFYETLADLVTRWNQGPVAAKSSFGI
ncbi:3-phosphoshikimate 1-carboxyvinyltransferase [Nocardiopsis sp. HNM0947]|uniref:3-phosphoshikimate 1-carboxyvinyltransferase n=1 Tax=Nocardiopsis coralli TaxID=2772213 RepID=A0ABR9P4D2_9ACTN|nr:3-phosphoshikimate 1-carboxyvinyltransferase [Nocardiopsis coralli]MBE2998702.1 3-phosphoshikimate 1-carboxyvinyltransferase [Nocardiopsis coralli]